MPIYDIKTTEEEIAVDCDGILVKDGALVVLDDFKPEGPNITPERLINAEIWETAVRRQNKEIYNPSRDTSLIDEDPPQDDPRFGDTTLIGDELGGEKAPNSSYLDEVIE